MIQSKTPFLRPPNNTKRSALFETIEDLFLNCISSRHIKALKHQIQRRKIFKALKMKLQLLLFAATILMTIESYPKALADFITSLPITLTDAFTTYSRATAARFSLFGRNLTNTTNHTVVPCSIQLTDQELARELQGVVVFGEVCIIFTVLAIVVGEGLAWRKRRGDRVEAEGDGEDSVTFED
jgi:hypothetical protein